MNLQFEFQHRVRTLNAEEMDIGYGATGASTRKASSAPDTPEIDPNDPKIHEIMRLARSYGGVILSGPPGTSKTFYANSAARVLTDNDDNRVAFTQFHPSYQYEDFMEGYRPSSKGGFALNQGTFLRLCRSAEANPKEPYVMVIDELSRGDAGRVFGEALTYIEKSKRGMPFSLASGTTATVPVNVLIVATMNPVDRGVDEIDAAFDRRFARLELEPDFSLLEDRLSANGIDTDLILKVRGWLQDFNGQPTNDAKIGHAYFWDVTNLETLDDLWHYQLKHHVNRAFKYDKETRVRLMAKWDNTVTGSRGALDEVGDAEDSDANH